MVSREQLAIPGIGSSLAPVIVGASEYGSLTAAYQSCIDPGNDPDISDQTQILLGNILEGGAIQVLELAAGIKTRPLGRRTFFHPTLQHLRAHPDATVEGENALVEAKCRGPYMLRHYDENEGEPLLSDYVQMQFQMLCSGAESVYHIVLFTNRIYRWWKIAANADDQKLIERECNQFWLRHVVPRVPPDPSTEAEIKLRFPISKLGTTVEGNNELAQAAQDARALREQIDELEEVLQRKRVALMSAMGDAESMVYDGRVVCTYKSQKRSDLDVKRLRAERPEVAQEYERDSSHRVLRIKSPLLLAAEHR